MSGREYWSNSDLIFGCLIDKKRVLAFRRAIRGVIKKGDIVVDIGAGTGILTLLALDAGAKKVYAIEIDDNLYQSLKETFHLNRYGNKVSLIKKDAKKVRLPEKVDVILCEMISTGLIDEIQIPALNQILKFTKKKFKVIPPFFHQYIDLVFNDNMFYKHKLPIIRYEYEWHKSLKSKSFSKKVLYSKLNFARRNTNKISKKIPIYINKNGVVNGIRIANQTIFHDGSKIDATEAYCIPLILPIKETKVKKREKFILNLSYKMCEGLKGMKYKLSKV